MNKNMILVVILAIVAVGGYFMYSKSTSAPKQEAAGTTTDNAKKGDPILVKISVPNAAKHPAARALHEVFKKNLEEKSGGRFKVQVYDGGVLGEEASIITQTQLGTIQMAVISDVLATVDPKVSVLNLPYIFENYEQVDAAVDDAALIAEITADLPKHKLIGLSIFENGFRLMTNSVRPINTFEDMAGLKIRSAHLESLITLLGLFGTNVAPLNFNELYGALQQKVVDGQENPWNTIVTQSFHEVQPHVAVTNHVWSGFTVVANLEWFNALSKEDQELVRSVAMEASVAERKMSREAADKNRQFLVDYGTQITTPDLEKFVQAVQPMYDAFYAKHPEYKPLVEKILAKKQESNK